LGVVKAKGADYVIIHDAVRPFVSLEILMRNKEAVMAYKAVDTCMPSFDTLVESFDNQKINKIPERKHYLRGQTPQSFAYDIILQAHRNAIKKEMNNISDDCRLVLESNHEVFIIEGAENNIKITTQLDLYLAEQLMREPRVKNFEKSKDLKDKLFAVIGASGGIGSSITHMLLEQGAKVLKLSRSSKEFPFDISKRDIVQKTFRVIEEKIGKLDGLINAAGILTKKGLETLSFEEIENELFVNLHGVIYSCKTAPLKHGGHIINIASSSFSKGRKDMAVYSATKAAVVNFSQALAEEMPFLRVNVIVPQRTKTLMRLKNFSDEDEKLLLEPAQVSKKVIELLQADNVTGQIIEVKK
jgi:2-C-methyl-D-erythritol 4-phosphate cytidylyltransferase